jgi:hypothetical protein
MGVSKTTICADKVFTKKDFATKREELRQLVASIIKFPPCTAMCDMIFYPQ